MQQLQRWLQEANLEVVALRRTNSDQVPAPHSRCADRTPDKAVSAAARRSACNTGFTLSQKEVMHDNVALLLCLTQLRVPARAPPLHPQMAHRQSANRIEWGQ